MIMDESISCPGDLCLSERKRVKNPIRDHELEHPALVMPIDDIHPLQKTLGLKRTGDVVDGLSVRPRDFFDLTRRRVDGAKLKIVDQDHEADLTQTVSPSLIRVGVGEDSAHHSRRKGCG